MRSLTKLVLFILIVITAAKTRAQETTATLNGIVNDQKGEPIAGASLSVKYLPTGYETHTQSNSKGIFVIPNLHPGGPYTITITFIGYEEEILNDVNLQLGNNPDMVVKMKSATNELKEVVVGAGRKGAGSGITVSTRELSTLPTIGRSLQDFTRLTPQSNNNSFAGTNFRYNNITLDGAINNDAIGFSNSFGGVSGGGQAGTSGAGTRTNPYSLDVIQEVQVQLSPYDVKIGNFTGGSVNAVTKSGSNDFHGSVYGYGRNQTLIGKSVDGLKTSIGSDFHDYQTGATLSGTIVKNRLFFIGNVELTRRQEPTFYNAGDPGAAISLADAQTIADFMKTNYNYNVGTYDQYKIFTNSNKYFGRLDWNINSRNTFMLRGIYTDGSGNNLERTSTNFQFSSTDFTQHTKNFNLVGELKTKFSNNVHNQMIASFIKVHEYRNFPGVLSPFMDIGGGKVWLGTWREASVYNMQQQTVEFTDNLTWNTGIHKFTFGTHNEFYNLTYGFINSWNGRWEYSNLTSFLNSQPSRVRGAFTFDDAKNTREGLYSEVPGSNYKVNLTSVYAEDEISVNRKFKLFPGIRIDYPFLSNKFPLDHNVDTTHNYVSQNPTYSHTPWNEFTNDWLGKATISPRLGFNFDVDGNQSLVIRGGTGIFVGRMPFAWMGYASTLTGTNFGNIDYKPASGTVVPLAMNPTTIRDTLNAHGGSSATSTHEVDIIDNNFKLPTIWRSNIAADIKFGKGYKLTLDAMYTKTLYDVQFQQINIKDTTAYYSTGPTQSPVYIGGKVNGVFSNVYLLTNTTQGWRYNLTAQLSKTTSNVKMGSHLLNLNWMASYTYGMSKDLSNGIRNSFQSNFELNPAIVANGPGLAYSNFDLRHRIVATVSLGFNWNDYNTTSLSFFYSGQSGSPYTFIYSSSPNPFGNASNANLVYIPKAGEQLNFADIKDAVTGAVTYSAAKQQTDFNNYISNDKYLSERRGEYTQRNGQRTPWNHELDMKLMHEFKFKGNNKQHSLQLSVDVFNLLNLLNNDWGHISFVTNVNNYDVNLLAFTNDAAGLKPGAPSTGYTPTFNFVRPPSTGHYYTVDPINSRWQAQVGLKYNF
jgi:hypothetical protein